MIDGNDVSADINAEQRIGASFVVDGKLRDWFDDLATRAIGFPRDVEEGAA